MIHPADNRSPVSAAAKALLGIFWAVLAGMSEAHGESSPAAPVREIHSRQRTGGPLPLSLRHEVDAAAGRSADWIRSEIAEERERSPGEILAAARALAAMMSAGRPASFPQRADAAIPGWLETMVGQRDASPPEARWLLEALRASVFPPGLSRDSGEASPGAEFPKELSRELSRALEEATRTLLKEAVPSAAPAAARTLLSLCDAAALAGMSPWGPGAETAKTRKSLSRKLTGLIRADPPDREDLRAEFFAGSAAAVLLLSDPLAIPAQAEIGSRDLSRNLAEGLDFFAGHSLAAAPEEAWLVIRALNRAAPNLLIDERASPPVTVDWRSLWARRLLSTQNIDPAKGTGFWTRSPDGNGTPSRPVPDFRLTVYAYLILRQL